MNSRSATPLATPRGRATDARSLPGRSSSAAASASGMSAVNRTRSVSEHRKATVYPSVWTASAADAPLPQPHSVVSVDELASLELVTFGAAQGAVRLHKILRGNPPSRHSSSAEFSLNSPVTVVLSMSSCSITSHEGDEVVANVPFDQIHRVEVLREMRLRIRAATPSTPLDVVLSIHSGPKLLMLYKLLVLRCKGVLPRDVDAVRAQLSRATDEAPPPPSTEPHRTSVSSIVKPCASSKETIPSLPPQRFADLPTMKGHRISSHVDVATGAQGEETGTEDAAATRAARRSLLARQLQLLKQMKQ